MAEIEIRLTEEAYRWLRDIPNCIAGDNPDAAKKVLSGIYGKAQELRHFPKNGHQVWYFGGNEPHLRAFLKHSPLSLHLKEDMMNACFNNGFLRGFCESAPSPS